MNYELRITNGVEAYLCVRPTRHSIRENKFVFIREIRGQKNRVIRGQKNKFVNSWQKKYHGR